MPKEGIRDKVEGNECDLSLSGLSAVPVKELVNLLTFLLHFLDLPN